MTQDQRLRGFFSVVQSHNGQALVFKAHEPGAVIHRREARAVCGFLAGRDVPYGGALARAVASSGDVAVDKAQAAITGKAPRGC